MTFDIDLDRIQAALDAYVIDTQLGEGAGGAVIRGEHRRLRRPVAIKALLPAFANRPEVRARFAYEAELLASLDHPHIVAVFDYVERDGLCLLIMELLSGGTLRERVARSRLSPETACAIGCAVSSALEYAHQKQVLHRDIKPDNLLFSPTGILKVTDFGIAKVLAGDHPSFMTEIDARLGTPQYMAPEQCLGRELSPATDVYSLGTVLYELLAGQLPFPDNQDALSTLYLHAHEQPAPLSRVAPAVPPTVAGAVMQALATEPSLRFDRAEQFGTVLAQAARTAWGNEWLDRADIDLISPGRAPRQPTGSPTLEAAVPPSPPPVFPTGRPRSAVTIAAVVTALLGLGLLIVPRISKGTTRQPHLPPSSTVSGAVTSSTSRPGGLTVPTFPTEGKAAAFPVLTASLVAAAPGEKAQGITFDGRDLWISDTSDEVFKVDLTGKVLDTFMSPDPTPEGLVWNGSGFFIETTDQNLVHRLSPDGKSIGSFKSPATQFPAGADMAWDGSSIWFASQFKLTKLNSQGVEDKPGTITFSTEVAGVDWDGANLLVGQNNFPCQAFGQCYSTLRKIDRSGRDIACFSLPIAQIVGLAWVNKTMWVLGQQDFNQKPSEFIVTVPPQSNSCATRSSANVPPGPPPG